MSNTKITIGLEQVLLAAAVDPSFSKELLADGLSAVRARGFSLAESEEAALRVASAGQLAELIDRIDTSEGNLKRRRFMRAVAATVVTIAASQGTATCSGPAEQVSADPPNETMGGEVDASVLDYPAGGNSSWGSRPDVTERPDAGPVGGSGLPLEVKPPDIESRSMVYPEGHINTIGHGVRPDGFDSPEEGSE